MQLPEMQTEAPQGNLPEVAGILATGLQRLWERKSSQKLRCTAETLLDCEPKRRGHVHCNAEDIAP